ncbi:MAG: alpha-ribazole phosphatase [Negativicutes bacterium]
MANSKIIYLIRHGRIQNEGEQRRYIGQIDVPLDAVGVRQAERMRERLARAGVGEIYCCDLERSRATAEILALNNECPVSVRSDLREIHLGEWEGISFGEVIRRFPGQFEARGKDIAYYQTPGGESFADCSRRVLNVFQEIVADMVEPVVIVGHAGVNRLILCHLLGMPIANLFRIAQDYACINVIQYTGNIAQVKLMNSVTL